MPVYGWQSKRYLFGQYQANVSDDVQQGSPSRFIATASYFKGTGDHIKIIADFGGVDDLLLLDTSQVPEVNRLNQEIDLLGDPELVSLNLLPANPNDWFVSFRIEITTDLRDPSPTSPEWPFVNNSDVTLYLYRNLLTQAVEVRSEPIDIGLTRAGVPLSTAVPEYVPLKHVQTVFYFSGQSVKLRAATVISDKTGCVKTALPAGSYDIEFYGAGILPSEYLQGYTVGAGDNLTPWSKTSTSGVAQAAEFSAIKNEFSTLFWPGYVVAEDFSPERAHLRDEDWQSNPSYGNNLALQLYGRVFAGKSYVDFIGVAIDPPPE